MAISGRLLGNQYYYIKPFIPRWLRIHIRRRIVLRKRVRCSDVWPINAKAAKPPQGWSGWPDQKRFAFVLTHDVDTAKGLERCVQLAAMEESFGFRSSFNFVAEDYRVSSVLRDYLMEHGFEIGVHGLIHKKNPFLCKKVFQEQVVKLNGYLKEWGSVGFRCPSMYHNLDWIGELNIEYDCSTFDTDPFEPQPDGMETIFPFWVSKNSSQEGYVELPYTLPQDHTLFVLMNEKDISLWKKKLDWIVECGGMVLVIVHPDYINFSGRKSSVGEYPTKYYAKFLEYIKTRYEGQYWHVLPKEMASFFRSFLFD